MPDNKFHFGKLKQDLEQLKRELPLVIANQAQNFFLSSFKRQGWEDNSFVAWEEVQRRLKDTNAYKYPKKKKLSRRTKPILVMTGRLRRAVANSIKYAANGRVLLQVNKSAVPYAEYQNNGTKRIKARKFMGDSAKLRRMQRKTQSDYIKRIMK